MPRAVAMLHSAAGQHSTGWRRESLRRCNKRLLKAFLDVGAIGQQAPQRTPDHRAIVGHDGVPTRHGSSDCWLVREWLIVTRTSHSWQKATDASIVAGRAETLQGSGEDGWVGRHEVTQIAAQLAT